MWKFFSASMGLDEKRYFSLFFSLQFFFYLEINLTFTGELVEGVPGHVVVVVGLLVEGEVGEEVPTVRTLALRTLAVQDAVHHLRQVGQALNLQEKTKESQEEVFWFDLIFR